MALVVKYSDNIHKGFANSLSIVLCGFIESYIFPNSFQINNTFSFGSLLVIISSLSFVAITNRFSMFNFALVASKEGDKLDQDLTSSGHQDSMWNRTYTFISAGPQQQLLQGFYQRLSYNISGKPSKDKDEGTLLHGALDHAHGDRDVRASSEP